MTRILVAYLFLGIRLMLDTLDRQEVAECPAPFRLPISDFRLLSNAGMVALFFIPAMLLLSACQKEPPAASGAMLTLSAAETGIDFANTLTETPQLNIIEYLYYYNGGGVAIGDINNDGLEDIFFTANHSI